MKEVFISICNTVVINLVLGTVLREERENYFLEVKHLTGTIFYRPRSY